GGYIACCQAIKALDTTERLPGISAPPLVIAGALDLGTPPAMAQRIAEQVPGAQLAELNEAAHLSVLEQTEAFAQAIAAWLSARARRPGPGDLHTKLNAVSVNTGYQPAQEELLIRLVVQTHAKNDG